MLTNLRQTITRIARFRKSPQPTTAESAVEEQKLAGAQPFERQEVPFDKFDAFLVQPRELQQNDENVQEDDLLNQLFEQKKKDGKLELGFSIKDEKTLLDIKKLHEKLFPIRPVNYSKNIPVSPMRESGQWKQLTPLYAFSLCFIVFILMFVVPQLDAEQKDAISSFLIQDSTWIRNFKKQSKSTLSRYKVEEWSRLANVTDLDELQSYLQQAIPHCIIPMLSHRNHIIHAIRLSQRRIRLTMENNTFFSSGGLRNYRWISPGLSPYHSFKEQEESTSSYGTLPFLYSPNGGYKQRGGFVLWVNAQKEAAAAKLTALLDHKFLDNQTASLTLDFLVTNEYLPSLSYVRLVFIVNESGFVKKHILLDSVGNLMKGYAGVKHIVVMICYLALSIILLVTRKRDYLACRNSILEKSLEKQGGSTAFKLLKKFSGKKMSMLQDHIMIALLVFGALVHLAVLIIYSKLIPSALDLTSQSSRVNQLIKSDAAILNFDVPPKISTLFDEVTLAFDKAQHLKRIQTGIVILQIPLIMFFFFRDTVFFTSSPFNILIVFLPKVVEVAGITYICFVVVCLAYAFVHYAQFGVLSEHYSTYTLSFLNTMGSFLGHWPNIPLAQTHPNLFYSIYFTIFVISCHIIVPLLTVAYISEAYWESTEYVKLQQQNQKDKPKYTHVLWRRICPVLNCLDLQWFRRKQRGENTTKEIHPFQRSMQGAQAFKSDISDGNQRNGKSVITRTTTGVNRLGCFVEVISAYQGNRRGMNYGCHANATADKSSTWSHQNESWGKEKQGRWNMNTSQQPSTPTHGIQNATLLNHSQEAGTVQYSQPLIKNQRMELIDGGSSEGIHSSHIRVKRNKNNLYNLLIKQDTESSILQLHGMCQCSDSRAITSSGVGHNWLCNISQPVTSPHILHRHNKLQKNFFSIRTTAHINAWLNTFLPQLKGSSYYENQSKLIFNSSRIASSQFPPLLGPWIAGISENNLKLSIFQNIKDSVISTSPAQFHTRSLHPRLPDSLESLGFFVDSSTGAVACHVPLREELLAAFLKKLLDSNQLLTKLTSRLLLEIPVLDVQFKSIAYIRLTVDLLTSGKIIPSFQITEIHPMFLRRRSTLLKEFPTIFLCLVCLILLLGEIQKCYLSYQSKATLLKAADSTSDVRLKPYNCDNTSTETPTGHHKTRFIFTFILKYITRMPVIDLSVLLLIACHIGILLTGSRNLKESFNLPVEDSNLDRLYKQLNSAMKFTLHIKKSLAWLTLLSLLRLCCLLKVIKKLHSRWIPLTTAVQALVQVFSFTALLMLSCAAVLFILLSESLEEFRNIWIASHSSLLIVVGRFNFSNLFEAHPIGSLLLLPLFLFLRLWFICAPLAAIVASFRVCSDECEQMGSFSGSRKHDCFHLLLQKATNFCNFWRRRLSKPRFEIPKTSGKSAGTQNQQFQLDLLPVSGNTAPSDANKPGGEESGKNPRFYNVMPPNIYQHDLTDSQFESLPLAMQLAADEIALQFSDRFRKLDFTINVSNIKLDTAEKRLEFLSEWEKHLCKEFQEVSHQIQEDEERLRYRLLSYEHTLKEKVKNLNTHISDLEQRVEEEQFLLNEAQEKYRKSQKNSKMLKLS